MDGETKGVGGRWVRAGGKSSRATDPGRPSPSERQDGEQAPTPFRPGHRVAAGAASERGGALSGNAVGGGGGDALRDCVEREYRRAYAELLDTARKRLSAMDGMAWVEPEDLVNDAVAAVLSGRARCNDRSEMLPFLKGVIRGLARNLRKRSRSVPLLDGQALAAPEGPSWDPLVALLHREESSRTQEFLQCVLSPRELQVFLMKEWEGKTYKEIGDELGIEPQTAKGYHRDARQRLKLTHRGGARG